MPEGPEVRCIVDNIKPAIGGIIMGAGYTEDLKYKWARDGIPGWSQLESIYNYPSVLNWKITDITAKGKLIRFDLLDTNDLKKLSILSTLGLEGLWKFESSNIRDKHQRVWFRVTKPGQEAIALRYIDSRNFGSLKIVTPAEADKKMKQIGWDLLQAPMDQPTWNTLQAKIGSKNIAETLMSQKHFSGIGNIYKAEILYDMKINPNTVTKNINAADWAQMNQTAHRILQKAYQANGSSVKSYTGGSFQNQLLIYGKKTCPLNHPVTKINQGDRTTWYCQTCQP